MNKWIQPGVTLLFVALFLVLLSGANANAQNRTVADNRFEISRQLDIFGSIVKEVEMFYVDSLDMEKTVRRGIDAMLEGLDPYTEYIPEKEMDALRFITTGEYAGVGAYIARRPEGVVITEIIENMPAMTAGLRAGDCFISIDTVNVQNESSERVSSLLKGVPNSKLKVKVSRKGEKKPISFEIIRKQIVVNQVVYYGVRNDDVGYVYLKSFTDKSAAEFKSAFDELKTKHNIKSLILDLRNNGGGLLESAVQIVNMFVPKGREIVSTKGKIPQWDRTYRTPAEPVDTVIPIAVLINGNSASAAEIVSGALQDLDRAVLVGQRSFGKGLVQAPRELPYDGSLKVTISKYHIPSGRCIQQIDYAHRGADGSAASIPDSLTSVFYTANGRPVRDGGGITPDFVVGDQQTPTIIYYLLQDLNVLFDYVTDYVQKHPTIPEPEKFEVTDDDFEALKALAKEKNFTYDRQSVKILKNLKDAATFEGYTSEADSTTFRELEARLTPNIDKDFARFETTIKQLMASEITKRYYFERGAMIQNLKDDAALNKAVEILSTPNMVASTLKLMPAPLSAR
ncbi:MAG: S41 family peptidase [Tannerellaceae bacterium]|jgi:carboxyl-terminal processing protease|nr:S41 family peptidase [Tannerellaceae bacterium]